MLEVNETYETFEDRSTDEAQHKENRINGKYSYKRANTIEQNGKKQPKKKSDISIFKGEGEEV